MPDRVERLERARRRLGLRQADLAATLRATQGHYSKVVRRRTPPGQALADRIDRWLVLNDTGAGAIGASDVSAKIVSLVASIRDQCAELALLVGFVRVDGFEDPDDNRSDQ